MLHRRSLLATLAAPAFVRAQGLSQPEKIVFATNWKAQAAHGGFYQALVDGTYARAGLAVEIRQGGPQVNNRPLLPAKKVDFLMTGNLLHGFDNARMGVPVVAVAAVFQKDPQALIAHPGQGYEKFESLKQAPRIWIAKDAQFSWWQWLKRRHGFSDEALRPYNYTLGPFLANKQSVQQGYSVAEPIYVRQQGGFDPVVHLLADHGWSTPSTLIDAHADTVARKPELVQRFVDASLAGWKTYLGGTAAQRAAADARMRQDNPEMSQAELEASHGLMLKQQLGGSPLGALTLSRAEGFLKDMVEAGLYKTGEVDVRKIVSERFAR